MKHDTTSPLWTLLLDHAGEERAIAAPTREYGLAQGGGQPDLDAFAAAIEADQTRAEPLPLPAPVADALGLSRISLPGRSGWALELVARDGTPVDALGATQAMRPLDGDGACWLLLPTRQSPCAVLLQHGDGLLLQIDEAGSLRLRAVNMVGGGLADAETDAETDAKIDAEIDAETDAEIDAERTWQRAAAALDLEPTIAIAITEAGAAEARALAAAVQGGETIRDADAAWADWCTAALRERHARSPLPAASLLAALLQGAAVPELTPIRDAIAAAPMAERLALRRSSQRAAARLRRDIERHSEPAEARSPFAQRRAALEAMRACLAAVDGNGALESWLAAVDNVADTKETTLAAPSAAADALLIAEAATAPHSWWLPALESDA